MDQIESAAEQPSISAPVAGAAAQSAQDKPATDLNPLVRVPSLKFPVPEFYSEDLD